MGCDICSLSCGLWWKQIVQAFPLKNMLDSILTPAQAQNHETG
jgi:hypothetical protein